MNRWVNFLSLLPGTTLTLLVISLQIRYLFEPTAEVQAAITDFFQFLQEYGEL